MVLGDLSLKLSMVLAAVAFVAALRWAGGRNASRKTFRLAYHGMTLTLALASVHLMAAILTHDFRFDYVVGYSSTDLPLVYLISGFWAGQQGTYLLWALMAALVGYGLFRKDSWEPARVMACYVPTIGFLLALLANSNGNPFRLLATAPADGRGLNPLLQDPWMASHPPLIFLGYVATTVPAVLALAALIKGRGDGWLAPAIRWSLVSFVTLGGGIILGGFWAYKVLGWGGFWGWDPVENASLVPWIAVTALLHGLLVQNVGGALRRTNLVLAFASYLLVLYATFLTRSGVLADFSVHSFPAGSIYRVLVAIMLVALGASVFAMLRYRPPAGTGVATELSWPMVFSVAIALLCVSATLVLLGTSWPILSTWAGKPAALGPAFYNKVSLPIYVLALAALGIAPLLGWARRPLPPVARRLLVIVAVAVAATAIAFVQGGRGVGNLLLFFVACVALASNVLRFVQVGRARLLNTGAALAHIGFSLMLAGIVASSAWGDKHEVSLPLGSPVDVMDRSLTYGGHVPGSEPRDRWRVVVEEAGGDPRYTDVTMFRFANGTPEGGVLHKPAIVRSLAGDLYIAPMGLDETRRSGGGTLDLIRGGTGSVGQAEITFRQFRTEAAEDGHGMKVWADIEVRSGEAIETAALPLAMVEGRLTGSPVEVGLLPDVKLRLERISVEQSRVLIRVDDPHAGQGPALAAEVSTKPLIGFMWGGTLLMLGGCGVAFARRYHDAKLAARVEAPAARPAKARRRTRPRAARVARSQT